MHRLGRACRHAHYVSADLGHRRRERPPRRAAVALALIAVLESGCTTIPPEQCASIDWKRQGFEDGRAGFGPSRLARHREACAGVGVQPDASAWEAGRMMGREQYCLLPNALEQGLARHGYEGVCADPRFGQLYGAARRLGDARHQVTFIDGEIDWRERELLTNTKLTDQRRAELVAEVRSLERQRDRAIVDRSEAGAALEQTRRLLGV